MNARELAARRVVAALRDVARPIIMAVCGRTRSNCIASTKIILDTLQSYGIDAQPLVTRVCVRNAVHLYQVEAWRRSNPTTAAPEFLQKHWRDDLGAWAIYIGYGAADEKLATGYDGHVVVHVPQLQLVLDAAIDQVDRPEKKIGPMPPVLVAQWDVARAAGISCDNIDQHGTRLTYERVVVADPDYQTAPDWLTDTAHIVSALRLAIASKHVEVPHG